MFGPLVLVECFGGLFLCVVSQLGGDMSPHSKGSTVLLCCQLPTNFHNIGIV